MQFHWKTGKVKHTTKRTAEKEAQSEIKQGYLKSDVRIRKLKTGYKVDVRVPG